MKRIIRRTLCLFFILLLCAISIASCSKASIVDPSIFAGLKIGDTVSFGAYQQEKIGG